MLKKNYYRVGIGTFVGCLMLTCLAGPASASPLLQVDIFGGTYDSGTETVVTFDKTFTVRGWLTPKNNAKPADVAAMRAAEYLMSIGIVPKTGTPYDPMTSFVFDGQTIDVTGDMEYGFPPLETMIAKDPGDLSSHGIFETFFAEYAFDFSSATQVESENVQDNPGVVLTPSATGGSYVVEFAVDVSNLSGSVDGQPIGIHFDLYNSELGDGFPDELDVDKFAPFSHDAEYVPGGGGFPPGSGVMPEPASMAVWALLALCCGVVVTKRKRQNRA